MAVIYDKILRQSQGFCVTHHASRNYWKPIDFHTDLGQIFERISGSHEVNQYQYLKNSKFSSAVLM